MTGLLSAAVLLAEKGYVEFPNIFKNHGIKINIDDTLFTIGSFSVRWYGVLICGVVIVSIILALRSCKKYGIDPNDLLDYLIFALPAAVIGLRVYYVAFNFSQYKDNLWSVFYFWEGGLAIYGGIIGAVIAIFIVSRVKKHKFLKIVDFMIGYVALGQCVGRWGNFFNQEAFGGPTTLPWGMTGDKIARFVSSQGWPAGTLVHPTFLYESLWCLIVFIVIMIYRRKFRKTEGECLAIYMFMYGLERMLVEGLRTDSLYIGNTGIRVSQLLSAILVVVGIALFIDLRVRYRKAVYNGTLAPDGEATESGFAGTMERLREADGDNADDDDADDGNADPDEAVAVAVAEAVDNAVYAADSAVDAAADAVDTAADAVDAAADAIDNAVDAADDAKQQ